MEVLQNEYHSEIGPLYLVASDLGLRQVAWTARPITALRPDEDSPAAGHLRQARRELEQYFAGTRRAFEVALDVVGSDFQRRVWSQLRLIPFGHTLSYGQIAARLETKAARAVGSANGRNPLCIITPCHRVIASDGSLGGFSGGLEIKERLLALERHYLENA